MTLRETRSDALAHLKEHYPYSYTICLICGMLSALLTMLGIVSYGVGIFLILPFLVMPFFFATQVSHYGLRKEIYPSFKKQVKYFGAYFVLPFRGVYRFCLSLLTAALVVIVGTSLFSIFSYYITGLYFPRFGEAYEALVAVFNNGGSVEDLSDVMNAYNSELMCYVNLTLLPAVFFGCNVFLYLTSTNSYSMYLKVSRPRLNPAYSAMLFRYVRSKLKGRFYGWYWALNFPLYLLFLLGYAGGALVSLQFTANFLYTTVSAIAGGLLLMSLFLPFFFANLESIFSVSDPEINILDKELREQILTSQRTYMEQMSQSVQNPDFGDSSEDSGQNGDDSDGK